MSKRLFYALFSAVVAVSLCGIFGCSSSAESSSSSSSSSTSKSYDTTYSKSYSSSSSTSKSSSSSSSKKSSSKSSSSAKETGRYYNDKTGDTLYTYSDGTEEYTDGWGNVVRGKNGKAQEYSTDGGKTWKKY